MRAPNRVKIVLGIVCDRPMDAMIAGMLKITSIRFRFASVASMYFFA
jgi:hypothetical protein